MRNESEHISETGQPSPRPYDSLEALGWDAFYKQSLASFEVKGCLPARVVAEHTHIYKLWTDEGEVLARVAGRLRLKAKKLGDYPAVGDWVAIKRRPHEKEATIHGVLKRKSRFSRKVAGRQQREQVIAANIDTVLLVSALDPNFSTRRIERYLTMVAESGAQPVIVLTKADLWEPEEIEGFIEELREANIDVPIHIVSAQENDGLDALAPCLASGQTLAILGLSGVGKSTLINRLMGQEVMPVREVREGDMKGRHTTTHRELFMLPGGAMIIDTPGIRELQLWQVSGENKEVFDDIEALAHECRFRDCRHRSEPGCAVLHAVEEGRLDEGRLASYHKLRDERDAFDRRGRE